MKKPKCLKINNIPRLSKSELKRYSLLTPVQSCSFELPQENRQVSIQQLTRHKLDATPYRSSNYKQVIIPIDNDEVLDNRLQ